MAQNVLTALGFKRKRYEDYLLDLEAKARELFGEDVNLNENSPMGEWVKLNAFQHAEANELAEKVWLSSHIDTAEGVALDYVVKKYGVTREQAQAATGNVTVTLNAGQTIAAGALTVATADGIKYVNTAGGTATSASLILPVVAIETGPAANVPPNTITAISTPIAGVTAVNNAAAMTGGRNTETDPQLRERYYATLSRGGSATADGIKSALLEIEGVRAAIVKENNLDVADVDGNPPHCVAPVILGGVIADIGKAILSRKAAGIRSYGTESVLVKDDSNRDQNIGFSFATTAEIYVNVVLSKNAFFPTNGVDLVETEVIKYIGGVDAGNQSYSGLTMAETVIHAQIVGAVIRNVTGIDDLTITLRKGTGGTYNAANVTIGETEVAETDAGKVAITIA